MAYYLAKTDPDTYSIDKFEQEQETLWDGVTNPQALGFIRKMEPGDTVFLYHSGSDAGVVGLATVTAAAVPDPKNAKSWTPRLRFVGRLDPPTSLAEIKASGLFADWYLVRQGRLSTMPAPETFVGWLRKRYPNAKF